MTIALVFAFTTITSAQTSGNLSGTVTDSTGAVLAGTIDTASVFPTFFNAGSIYNSRDDRSDNKGTEPEGVTVGKVFGGNYASVGLERIGGVIIYDITNPYTPRFVQYVNNRNFLAATNTPAAGDLAPKGLHFISAEDSPAGKPLLIVANETSGTTTVYEIVRLRSRRLIF